MTTPVGEIRAVQLRRMAWLGTACVLAVGYAHEIAAAASRVRSPFYGFPGFSLDAEAALPAWYEATMMLLCALLMLLLRLDPGPTGRRDRAHWTGLGCIFVLLSLDETVGIHEQLAIPLRTALSATGVFYFTWVVAGIALVALLAIIYLPFVLRLGRDMARELLVSALLFVTGAIGMEMLGGWVYSAYGSAPLYSVVMAAEETLELAGVTMLFGTLLRYAASRLPPVRVTDLPGPAPTRRRAAADQSAGRGS